jgi:integrase
MQASTAANNDADLSVAVKRQSDDKAVCPDAEGKQRPLGILRAPSIRINPDPPAETLQPVATFAYITGWRISEILNLQWPRVDFQAGFVRLEPGTTKNDEARVFPFTEELRAILEAQRANTEALKKENMICPWVFHRNGKPIRYFRCSWKTACRKAGIPARIVHDFRRTAVRNLVRAGIPERVAMKMTGHKTRSVFERYNIVSEGDLFDAARRLDFASQTQLQTQSAQNAQPAENPVPISIVKSKG